MVWVYSDSLCHVCEILGAGPGQNSLGSGHRQPIGERRPLDFPATSRQSIPRFWRSTDAGLQSRYSGEFVQAIPAEHMGHSAPNRRKSGSSNEIVFPRIGRRFNLQNDINWFGHARHSRFFCQSGRANAESCVGRSGTTFLMQLFTKLNLPTGFDDINQNISFSSNAGMKISPQIEG